MEPDPMSETTKSAPKSASTPIGLGGVRLADNVSSGRSAAPSTQAVFELNGLGVLYGGKQAVKDVSADLYRNEITAFIGPSGCGKSTILRCLNRMNDLVPSARVEGSIRYRGQDLYASEVDPVEVRKRIG